MYKPQTAHPFLSHTQRRFFLLVTLTALTVAILSQQYLAPLYAASDNQAEHTTYLPLLLVPEPPPPDLPDVWERIGNHPEGLQKFYDVAACDGRHVAGTTDGVYTLVDGVWQRETAIPGGTVLQVSFGGDCDTIYVGNRDNGVYYGTLVGTTWQWTQVYAPDDEEIIRSLVVRTVNNVTSVYIGGRNGLKWADNPVNADATWFGPILPGQFVTGLTLQPDTQAIYAAVWQTGIFRNEVGTVDWIQQDSPQFSGLNSRLYKVDTQGQQVVTGTEIGIFAKNGGDWVRGRGLTSPTHAVQATGKALYAGQLNNAGIFVSRDGGANWSPFVDGLDMNAPFFEDMQVWSLPIEDGKLYAATTSGIWRLQNNP